VKIRISEAKGSSKDKKNLEQINGKFNGTSSGDINK
jgi:hypothetical protein